VYVYLKKGKYPLKNRIDKGEGTVAYAEEHYGDTVYISRHHKCSENTMHLIQLLLKRRRMIFLPILAVLFVAYCCHPSSNAVGDSRSDEVLRLIQYTRIIK